MNRFLQTKTQTSVMAFLLLVFVGLIGCSSQPSNPKTFPVTGSVTQNGKTIEGATVIFVPDEDGGGAAASGKSDASGKFAMTTYTLNDGVRPGSYKIKVSKYDKPQIDDSKRVVNMTPEEEMKAYDPDAKPTPPPKNLLPKKYESELTSGLSHTVADKPTTFDIDLK